MGALLTVVDGGVRVRQFFADDEGQEEELLARYMEILSEVDVLVSYNGNGFDFPYLKHRLKRYHFDASFSGVLSLDMYVVLNKFSNFREIIPNLKQKTVEEYLGLRDSRDDMIDGGQSVELYFRYLMNKSDELRDTMLLHNRDDVLQLARILWVFDNLDIHRISANIGFPVVVEDRKVLVTGIKIKTRRLDIIGKYKGITGRYNIFRDDSTVSLEPKSERNLLEPESDYGAINISVPLRYEDKVTYILKEDLEGEALFFFGESWEEFEYMILKNDGVPDYKVINEFIKALLKDILKKI
jgi:hypothetical protein